MLKLSAGYKTSPCFNTRALKLGLVGARLVFSATEAHTPQESFRIGFAIRANYTKVGFGRLS